MRRHALFIGGYCTVSVWAKPDQQSAYGGLFDKTIGGATDQSYELLQETDRWSWWLWGTFGVVNIWTPVEPEEVGAWVHLVATFDGTTSRLYKNGVLVASAAAEGTLTAGEGMAQIGHLGSNIFAFAGSIDEVAVYSSALSDTVIASHYAQHTAAAAITLQLSASDPDSDPLLYTATGLPVTLVLNPTTGLISGNPTTAGSFSVTATVTDPGGLAASQSFTWTFEPPSVSIALTSPFPGTVFRQPIDLSIAANATATNATITQVEFFADQTSLGTDSTAPYEVSWTAVPVGSYSITAVATDSSGATTSSAPVAISVTQSGSGSGTLGTPIATPSPGMYGPPLAVTLEAASGATIRYTTDGSTPSTSSPLYAGPIAITEDTYLSARAFQSGWTTSPTFAGTYRLDTTPPIVTAIVSPPPTAAGWNNTDVVIRFECTDPDGTGVDQCPGNVSVIGEGAGHVITRTATDHAGNAIDTSVTVNIDKIPPSMTLTDPLASETESPSLAVSGTVSDSLSGVSWIDCNWAIQSPQGGNLSCTLSLDPGGNAVLISVTDQAGNMSSVSSRTRYATGPATALHLSPQKFSLTVGGTRGLTLVDNFERTVEDPMWTSSNEAVASIDDHVVSAVAAGTTTITATVGSLSASVDVTVYSETTSGGTSGTTLPVGAVRWERQSPAGYSMSQILTGMPDGSTVESGGLSRFAIEHPVDGVSRPRVTALDENGRVKWANALPVAGGSSVWASSNSLGGLLVSDYYSIFSLDASGTPGWRYNANGGAQMLGQGPAGTIFLLEENAGRITVLDGEHGAVRGHVDLPLSSREAQDSGGHCIEGPFPYKRFFSGSTSGRPAIDADDTLHVFVSSSNTLQTCTPPHNFERYYSNRLELWSVTKSGELSSTALVSKSSTGSAPEMGGEQIVPTSDGALIFSWGGRDPLPTGDFQEYGFLSRKQGGISSIPASFDVGDIIMGEGNTAFVRTFEGTSALDATSLNMRWTSMGGALVTSTDGGGVMVHDGENLHTLDAQGTVINSAALSSLGKLSGTGWVLRSTDTTAVEQEMPPIRWSNAGFSMPGGSLLGMSAPPDCVPRKTEYRLNNTPRDYFFTFGSSVTPHMKETIEEAARSWKYNGYEQELRAASDGETNLTLIRLHMNVLFNPIAITVFPTADYDPTTIGNNEKNVASLFRPPRVSDGIALDKFGISFYQASLDGYPEHFGAERTFQEKLLKHTALHELGHLIGLAHTPSDCWQQGSIMYGVSETTEQELNRLGYKFLGAPTGADKRALQERIYGRIQQ